MRTQPLSGRKEESGKLTRKDFAFLVGLGLLLLAFLLLTSTPQVVYRWWKRDGYSRTEIEVLSPPESQLSSMEVRVRSTGQRLSIRRTSFTNSRTQSILPAWYNPDARLVLGLTVFDERILCAETYRELPDGAGALGGAALNIAVAVGGLSLLRWSTAPDPASRRKRKRQHSR